MLVLYDDKTIWYKNVHARQKISGPNRFGLGHFPKEIYFGFEPVTFCVKLLSLVYICVSFTGGNAILLLLVYVNPEL